MSGKKKEPNMNLEDQENQGSQSREAQRRATTVASKPKKAASTQGPAPESNQSRESIPAPDMGDITAFDLGLVPDKIVGITEMNGELSFLMKWKDTDETHLVPCAVANIKCPQVVIAFYQANLTWGIDPAAHIL